MCKDISNLGRWGNGDVEVYVNTIDDLPYVVGLIRQSFERQMDNVDEQLRMNPSNIQDNCMPKRDSEDALEQEIMKLFSELDYRVENCFHETFGKDGTLGREHKGEVVLVRRLRPILEKLNPKL